MTQAKQILYSPVDIEDGEYVDFERDEKMDAENAEFEQFKSEMHDAQFDAKITVGKKLTDSNGRPLGRQIFECFECGVDDYTFSQLCTRIREDFGTGLYQIQGRDSKGKYKFKKTVGILAPNATDNPPAGNDVGILLDKFSDAMQRQQMATEQMYLKLTGPQTGSDAFEQITKMVTAVAGVLGTLGIKLGGNPPPTMADQFKEMMMMKKFMDSFAGDSGAGGDANLYSLLTETMRSFGGPIATAIAAGQDSGDLNPAGLLAAPNPGPGDASPLSPEQIAQIETDKAMKANIEILLMNAKSGVDAKQFAQIVVNNTPDDKLDTLYEFLNAEDYLQRFIAMNPEVETFKNWFIVLRDAVIDLLTEPETGTTIPESEQSDFETVAGKVAMPQTGSDISDNNGDTATDTERASGD